MPVFGFGGDYGGELSADRHGEPVTVPNLSPSARFPNPSPSEPVALSPRRTGTPQERRGRSGRGEPVRTAGTQGRAVVARLARTRRRDRRRQIGTRGTVAENLTETLRKAAHGQDKGAAVVSTPKTADILGVIPNKYFRSNPCIYWRLCVFTKNFVGVAPTRGYTVGVFGKIADMKQTLIKNEQRRTGALFGGGRQTLAAAGGVQCPPQCPHFQKGTLKGDIEKILFNVYGIFSTGGNKNRGHKGDNAPRLVKPFVLFRPLFRTARAAETERHEMKKQSKPKAAADKQAAAKPKRTKTEAGNFKFSVGGVVYEVSETATERELLKALVIGTIKISEQVEALRRTLWRIGEIREYEGKGAKAAAKGKPKADAAKGGEK